MLSSLFIDIMFWYSSYLWPFHYWFVYILFHR